MTAKRKPENTPTKQGGYLTQKETQKPRPEKERPPQSGETPTTPDGAATTNPDDANEPRRGGSTDL
jgi:hypothetical protein